MNKVIIKYSNQINGYLFILPACLIISLFGIFPVFFAMYMFRFELQEYDDLDALLLL